MGERAEKAVERHARGYNCCQAVACAFADKLGVDESLLYRACEGFGLGMGNAKGVCGAMSGAAIVAGLLMSDGNTEVAGMTKAKTTKAAAAMQAKFTERVGALRCIDIKTGNNGGMFTSCDECIRIAAEIVEENLGL
jgi:C_GCAxxG_C_C family probable redox protein